jgi:hypothetical protein
MTKNDQQFEEEGYALERPKWRHYTPRGLWRLASYRFGFYRWPERSQMAVAWHMPHWLVRQCINRGIAHATTGHLGNRQHVPSILAIDMFRSWDDSRGGDRWAVKFRKKKFGPHAS